MNNIIGTAGHVDHGKTLLIKALTGIDTDRLKEEKKRGITIELGFAYLTLPDGERAGIIDVPGHEKFIRNMLAGAGSIDLALLVIAADEGIMPQTREHLDILSLLDIKRGVVALTKIDLVDTEWLDMVLLDVREGLAGTFLADAPIMPVSAVSKDGEGEGIWELRQCLYDLLAQSPEKAAHIPFRMPVDRVFTADGFGTVVTGTLIEGELSVGDSVTIFPSMKTAKARNLQTHTEKVQTVHAGQRAAVNLAGISHADIQKGDVLAAFGSMINSTRLDVRLDIPASTEREILHGSRLHLHHGTRDLLCKLRLLDCDCLVKGEQAYAQLQLYEPLAVKPGDRFVVRFYSPLETVGGGIILDPNPQKHPRGNQEILDGFKVKETGSLHERIAQMILDRSGVFPLLDEIKYCLFENNPQFDEAADELFKTGVLLKIGENRVIHRQSLESVGQRCRKILLEYHAANPLNKGIPRNELWQPLLPYVDAAIADRVIGLLERYNIVKTVDGRVSHPDFNAVMNEQHRQISDAVIKILLDSGYATPSYDEIFQPYANTKNANDKKIFKQAFDALIADGTVIMLTPQIIIHQSLYAQAMQTFKNLASQQLVTLAEFRDALETSRKYAVALLEHFDRQKFTQKVGDARRLANV